MANDSAKTQTATCEVPEELKRQFKEFKMKHKAKAAFIMKINKEKLAVELDEIMTNVTMEDIATSLPESAPRYIAYLAEYEWPDGRKSYPLLCIFYCPYVVSPALGTMYASTKTLVMNVLQIMKVFDCRDPEELTTEWLNKKLEFFK